MFVIPENKDHKEIRVIGKELMYDDLWVGELGYDGCPSPRISFNSYVDGAFKVEVLDALKDPKFIELAKMHDVYEVNSEYYIRNLLREPKNLRSVLIQLTPNLANLKIALDYAEDDKGLITYAFMGFIDKLELKMTRGMVNFTDYELEEIRTVLKRIQYTKTGRLSFYWTFERCIALITKELDYRKTLWYRIKQWF